MEFHTEQEKNLEEYRMIKYGSSLRLIYYVRSRAGQLNDHKTRTFERDQAGCANCDLKKVVEGYLAFLLLDRYLLRPKILNNSESWGSRERGERNVLSFLHNSLKLKT